MKKKSINKILAEIRVCKSSEKELDEVLNKLPLPVLQWIETAVSLAILRKKK